MKLKTYIASSVWLDKVEDRFRGNNGNAQFTIVVRTTSHERVAELIGRRCSVRHLREFCGISLAGPWHQAIPKEDNVIYYFVGSTKHGYVGRWLAYWPNLEVNSL